MIPWNKMEYHRCFALNVNPFNQIDKGTR